MTAQTILPANSVVDSGIVTNSVRFNDDDGAYMHKTPGSASAAGRRKFTISAWVKRGQTTTNAFIFSAWTADNDAGHFAFGFESAERLTVDTYSTNLLTTNRVFRDPSAWYHVVCAIDTTNGTANNRVRLYVNGVEETSFAARNNPDQNADLQPNNAVIQAVGTNYYNTQANVGYDGYMAEFCMIDNQQLTPTSFGEFDSDTPTAWKPINVSGLTFGTNGFYLDFENSANLGNDKSGGTDLTEVNLAAADQSTDTCVNNFATWNPLRKHLAFTATFTEGNTTVEHGQADQNQTAFSTMAVSTGKWYAEFQCSTNASNFAFGIARINTTNDGGLDSYPGSLGGMHYAKNGEIQWYAGGDANSDTGTTFAHTDIIGVLFDLDNTRLYFYKNDTLVNSGGIDYSVGTAVDGSTSETTYYFAAGSSDGGTNPVLQANFGGSSGFAISSAQSDPDGYGNFEFATKGGYALCTKNLAEYG
tara:strand:+ start:6 stop:1427 length:1422 start_codon:yes stop_codon:yes gene_type:complete